MMMNFAAARQNMVESQLRPNRVIDERLLAAFQAVPRENFVPGAFRSVAYSDGAIALSGGRALLEPMVLGRLIQEAMVRPADVALDIGGGAGYGPALLSCLAAKVVALEEEVGAMPQIPANVTTVAGPLNEGWAAAGPYDVILIEGGIEAVPPGLAAQLNEGGRLLAVRMGKGPVGQATLWRKADGALSPRPLFDAAATRLPAFAHPSGFVF